MKIYTKAGDDGSTGLIGGSRVPKSDPRIECIGAIEDNPGQSPIFASILLHLTPSGRSVHGFFGSADEGGAQSAAEGFFQFGEKPVARQCMVSSKVR